MNSDVASLSKYITSLNSSKLEILLNDSSFDFIKKNELLWKMAFLSKFSLSLDSSPEEDYTQMYLDKLKKKESDDNNSFWYWMMIIAGFFILMCSISSLKKGSFNAKEGMKAIGTKERGKKKQARLEAHPNQEKRYLAIKARPNGTK